MQKLAYVCALLLVVLVRAPIQRVVAQSSGITVQAVTGASSLRGMLIERRNHSTLDVRAIHDNADRFADGPFSWLALLNSEITVAQLRYRLVVPFSFSSEPRRLQHWSMNGPLARAPPSLLNGLLT